SRCHCSWHGPSNAACPCCSTLASTGGSFSCPLSKYGSGNPGNPLSRTHWATSLPRARISTSLSAVVVGAAVPAGAPDAHPATAASAVSVTSAAANSTIVDRRHVLMTHTLTAAARGHITTEWQRPYPLRGTCRYDGPPNDPDGAGPPGAPGRRWL